MERPDRVPPILPAWMRKSEGIEPLQDVTLCEKRNAIVSLFLSRDPKAGIAIWSAPRFPSDPAANRISLYNDSYCDIVDVSSLGDGRWANLLPPQSLFKSRPNAAELAASVKRAFDATSAVGDRRVSRAVYVLQFLTVALRVKLLTQEVIGIDAANGERELIASMTLLPQGSVLPADLQVPYGVVDERHLKSRSLVVTTQWNIVDGKLAADARRKLAERATKKASEGFQCKECSATNTSQRRLGPDGMKSLCNRCGLRWKRSTEQKTTPTPSPPLAKKTPLPHKKEEKQLGRGEEMTRPSLEFSRDASEETETDADINVQD